MSRSLGQLTLDVVARIGGYTAGLEKAEREAQKRAKAIEKVFNSAGKAIGVGIGAAVTGALAGAVALDNLIKQAGEFADTADRIGGSAEGLASFALAAGTTETSIETIATASVKLSKALVDVDDDTSKVGAALKALNLDIEDFRKLKPEERMEALAKALATFDDEGDAKTAVLESLVKGGSQLLPFLKELEAQGGRQVILTEEQIKQADEYADAQAKARTQLSLYAQAAATQALPALNALTKTAVEFIEELIGIDKVTKQLKQSTAVADFAESAVKSLAFVIDSVDGLTRLVQSLGAAYGGAAAIVGAIVRGDFAQVPQIVKDVQAQVDSLLNRETFSAKLSRNIQDARQAAANARIEDRGFTPAGNRLNFTGARDKEKKAAAEKQTEAERYLESLQKQLDKTKEFSIEEQLLADIQSGRLKVAGKVTQDMLVQAARAVDLAKEAEKAEKDRMELGRAMAIEQGDAVNKANDARQKMIDQLLDATPTKKLEEQRAAVQALTEEYQKGAIGEGLYLEAVSQYLDLNSEKLEKQKSLVEELGLTFTSAFEDAITGGKGLKEVLKGLEQDILRIVTRKLVTEPLGNAAMGLLSGGGSDGGGLLGGLGGLFKNLFSGFFAEGGFIPPGHWGVAGEKGAERVYGGRTGVTVQPNGGGGAVIQQSFSFAGQVDHRTQMQVGAAAAAGAQRALARNG